MGPERTEIRSYLVAGLRALRDQTGASSIHATFLQEADLKALTSEKFLQRDDQQFHWFNDDYGNFDDFLAALASRKRKAIRRERRDALANDISIEWVTGGDITEAHWDAFFAFYMDTGSRKWGRPYLNRRFFSLIGERMAERVLLVMAKRNGRHIAGAINFIGDKRLYGRNWGCIEDHPFLHFEVCYYQAIEFAIARGLDRVEAGAQGEHKLARGYRPVITSSAHDIADPSLRRAVAGLSRSGASLRVRSSRRAIGGLSFQAAGRGLGSGRGCVLPCGLSVGSEAFKKFPQLLLDLLIGEAAVLVEDRLRARHHQAPLGPEIGSQRSQDRKPRILGQDRAEAARRRADDSHGLAAENALDVRIRSGEPVDGVLEHPGIELLYSGVTRSSPSAAAMVSFNSVTR